MSSEQKVESVLATVKDLAQTLERTAQARLKNLDRAALTIDVYEGFLSIVSERTETICKRIDRYVAINRFEQPQDPTKPEDKSAKQEKLLALLTTAMQQAMKAQRSDIERQSETFRAKVIAVTEAHERAANLVAERLSDAMGRVAAMVDHLSKEQKMLRDSVNHLTAAQGPAPSEEPVLPSVILVYGNPSRKGAFEDALEGSSYSDRLRRFILQECGCSKCVAARAKEQR